MRIKFTRDFCYFRSGEILDVPDDDAPAAVFLERGIAERVDGIESRFMGSLLMREMHVRMAPKTLDEGAREIELTAATKTPVRRNTWDMGSFDEILDVSPRAVRLDRMNRGAPLLDSHDYYGGTRAMLGAIVPGSARIEGGKLVARAKFSRSAEGDRAFQDAKDGVLRHVSIGYLVHARRVDETTSPPTHTITDWEPHEVSAVAIPADPRSGFQ